MIKRSQVRKTGSWSLILLLLLSIVAACKDFTVLSPGDTDSDKPEIEKIFSLGGAPVQVKVRLSQETIALTDRLKMTLLIEYSEDVRIIPPYLSEVVYAPLLLTEKPQNDVRWSQDNQFLINEWHYVFEPIESGKFTLNAFTVFFRLNQERTADIANWPIYKIRIEPIPYQVLSVELDPAADIRDIKGFMLPEYRFIPVVITAGIILILGGMGFAFFLYRSRFKKEGFVEENPVDFCRQALDELDCLEQKDLIGKQAFDQLHTELSAILRRYLENYFQIKAQEQTTEEFIVEISESKQFSGEWRNMLQQFLRLADLVKFATFEPGADISRGAVRDVRSFIVKTGRQHGI